MGRITVIIILSLLPIVFFHSWILPPANGVTGKLHAPIYINGDLSFTSANGVTAGNGSATNPYIIADWNISGSAQYGEIALLGTSAHVIIRNVYIDIPGSCSGIAGIFFFKVANAEVANSTLTSGTDGIFLYNSTSITITGNSFANVCQGIENGPFPDTSPSSNLTITHNRFTNDGIGTFIRYASKVSFDDNTISYGTASAQFEMDHGRVVNNIFNNIGGSYGGTGLLIHGSDYLVANNSAFSDPDGLSVFGRNNRIVNNTAFLDGTGIVASGFNDTISGNYAQLNTGCGIIINQAATDANISSNYAVKDGGGICLNSAINTTISGNNIYKDGTGLSISLSNNTLVYHNNLFLNSVQIVASGNSWLMLNKTYPISGNYWSNYNGTDRCSGPLQNICTGPDGIGDTPLTITTSTGNIQDHYPLMNPYGALSDIAPIWPLGSHVEASNVGFYGATISWSTSLDDTEVVAYRVYANDTILATVAQPTRSYSVTGLTPGDAYNFRVQAEDTAGLWTRNGPMVTFYAPRTLPAPPPPPSVEIIIREGAYSSSFSPSSVTVYGGQTVEWFNSGYVTESVTSCSEDNYPYPSQCPIMNAPGLPGFSRWIGSQSSFQFTFATPGTYYYYDVFSDGTHGSITVLPVPADFSISADPSQVALLSARAGVSTITVSAIGGFTGTIHLSVSVSPVGLTCLLSTTQLDLGPSTTLGLSCIGSPGTYHVTIVGTNSTLSRSAILTYSVGNSSGSPSPLGQPTPPGQPSPQGQPNPAKGNPFSSIALDIGRLLRDTSPFWIVSSLALLIIGAALASRRKRKTRTLDH